MGVQYEHYRCNNRERCDAYKNDTKASQKAYGFSLADPLFQNDNTAGAQ